MSTSIMDKHLLHYITFQNVSVGSDRIFLSVTWLINSYLQILTAPISPCYGHVDDLKRHCFLLLSHLRPLGHGLSPYRIVLLHVMYTSHPLHDW